MQYLRLFTFSVVLSFLAVNNSFAQYKVQDPGFPEDMYTLYYHAVDTNVVWAVGGRIYDKPVYQGFSKTIDGGDTWTTGTVPEGANYFFMNIFALNDSVAWVTMVDNVAKPHEGRIFKTTDGGDTWTVQFGDSAIAPSGFNGLFNWVYFWEENEGLAVADHGHGNRIEIFKTSDGGKSWKIVAPENIPETLPDVPEQPTASNRWVAGDSTIWFSTDQGRVFSSTNRGQSWTAANVGFGKTLVYASFQDELNGLATAPLISKNIAKTTDGGASWVMLPDTLPKNAILFHVNGTDSTYMYFTGELGIILGTGDHGYGFTNDNGETYEREGNIPFNGLTFINDSTGWMGNSADNKIYKWTEPIITDVEEISPGNNPKDFTLSQNYPNPFNPSTIIKFTLSEQEHITLEVYNPLGQKIKTLLNKPMVAGTHLVEFNAKNLPSGIYFYRIEAGKFQQVKKMVLMK